MVIKMVGFQKMNIAIRVRDKLEIWQWCVAIGQSLITQQMEESYIFLRNEIKGCMNILVNLNMCYTKPKKALMV